MVVNYQLQRAIERLYRVFAQYPLADEVSACPCCHSPADEKKIHSRLLHQLTPEDLQVYAMDSLYTWGGVDDFRHFLPRLFELAVSGDWFGIGYANIEVLLGKLTYAEWRTWPAVEQKTIKEFLHSFWRAALDTPPENLGWGCEGEIETVICAIAGAEHDLAGYFQQWLKANSLPAFQHLVLIITQAGVLSKKGRPNAFWERNQLDQLRKWLQAGKVRKKLLHSLELWPDIPFAAEAELAIALLP